MLFDPFNSLDTIFARPRLGTFLPSADVSVGAHDMVLTLDLPGLTADDVDLQVVDGHLVVRGERRRPDLPEGQSWAHTERAFGAFERRMRLPEGVAPDAITASMDNGVLSLIVPKPERLKPRSIRITTGNGRRQLTETAA